MKPVTLLMTCLAMGAAGCIHTHETVVKDSARVPVDFENDAAARLFYEALSRSPHRGQREESKTEVSLPIIFEHERKVVRGPNESFNEAVAQCDTNRDGRITEAEARQFAERVK